MQDTLLKPKSRMIGRHYFEPSAVSNGLPVGSPTEMRFSPYEPRVLEALVSPVASIANANMRKQSFDRTLREREAKSVSPKARQTSSFEYTFTYVRGGGGFLSARGADGENAPSLASTRLSPLQKHANLPGSPGGAAEVSAVGDGEADWRLPLSPSRAPLAPAAGDLFLRHPYTPAPYPLPPTPYTLHGTPV